MKKILFLLVFLPFLSYSQNLNQLQEIDLLLFEAKFEEAAKKCDILLSDFPTNASLLFKAAMIQQNLNFDKKATFFIEKALLLDSTKIDYLNFYANNLAEVGRIKEAISLFNRILQKMPNNFYALDKLYQLYIKERQFSKANTRLEALTRMFPSNPHYLRQMAFCYTKQKGGGGFAMGYYQKAYELDSSDVISIRQLSNFYLRASKYPECIRIAERGVLMDSTISEFYRLQGMAYFAKNHNFRALPNFLKAIQYGDSTLEIVKSTGIAYYLIKKYKEADVFLSAAYTEDSTDYMTTLYLGRNYFGLEAYDLSIDFYKKTYHLMMPNNYLLNNFYGDMAISLAANNMHQEALEYYEKRFQLFGYLRDADYYAMALSYDKLQNNKKAIEFFEIYVTNVKKYMENPYENEQFVYAENRLNRLKGIEHMKN